jgi:hypothetical protein
MEISRFTNRFWLNFVNLFAAPALYKITGFEIHAGFVISRKIIQTQ